MSELLSEIDEALGQQEETTEEVSPPAEPVRDEQGRFASAEVPEETEEEVGEGEMILGKFKSPDDLAKSYESLSAKLDEQGAELGELRQMRQQLTQQQVYQQQPTMQLNQETVDWFDQQVMDNPQGSAVWALRQDPSGVLYNRAMEAWYEESPRQASAFEREMEMGAMAQAVDQRLSSITAPMQARAHQNDFSAAWNAASQQHPDLVEHGDAILEAAQSAPEVVALLQSGTLQDKQRVIENLYYLAKGKQATSLGAAAQDMAAQQAQETRAAKDESFVASSGQRNEPKNKSNVEKWLTEVFDPAAQQYYGS